MDWKVVMVQPGDVELSWTAGAGSTPIQPSVPPTGDQASTRLGRISRGERFRSSVA
jgi:hypothetical protein